MRRGQIAHAIKVLERRARRVAKVQDKEALKKREQAPVTPYERCALRLSKEAARLAKLLVAGPPTLAEGDAVHAAVVNLVGLDGQLQVLQSRQSPEPTPPPSSPEEAPESSQQQQPSPPPQQAQSPHTQSSQAQAQSSQSKTAEGQKTDEDQADIGFVGIRDGEVVIPRPVRDLLLLLCSEDPWRLGAILLGADSCSPDASRRECRQQGSLFRRASAVLATPGLRRRSLGGG